MHNPKLPNMRSVLLLTVPDTVVILRDQAEEFPPCQQLYNCQRWSLKVGYVKPKSGMKVRNQNVNKEN